MSFDLTNLHTLIMRAHDRHKIPVGKVMRVALQAAAKRKFPLYKGDGSRIKLSEADRTLLLQHAAIAEQQIEFRWWTKKPWIGFREVQASEPSFGSGLMRSLARRKPPSPRWRHKQAQLWHRPKQKQVRALKSQGIEGVIEALWSGNIPNGLSAKERNKKIIDYLAANGLSVSTSPERAIQRVLKARRQTTK
jgi:hypothetical protein